MVAAFELIDTSIKVGLGAFISWFTTYWLAGVRFRQNRKVDKVEHHRDLMEDVARNAEQVHHVFTKYFEMIQEYMNATRNGYDWPQSRRSELFLILDELVASFNDLTTAESKLLLLKEKRLYTSLRKFRSKVVFFRRHFYIDKKDLNEQEAHDIKREVGKLREQFFDALSEKYSAV